MIANELRIGNWVSNIHDIPMIVKAIYEDTIYVDFKGNVGALWEFNKYEPFKPIELTEEILLKCGFKHETMFIIKNLYLIEYGDFNFALDENNGFYHVKLSNHSFGHEKQVGLGMIKYLHQLQNLYFALTGTELKIEL